MITGTPMAGAVVRMNATVQLLRESYSGSQDLAATSQALEAAALREAERVGASPWDVLTAWMMQVRVPIRW